MAVLPQLVSLQACYRSRLTFPVRRYTMKLERALSADGQPE